MDLASAKSKRLFQTALRGVLALVVCGCIVTFGGASWASIELPERWQDPRQVGPFRFVTARDGETARHIHWLLYEAARNCKVEEYNLQIEIAYRLAEDRQKAADKLADDAQKHRDEGRQEEANETEAIASANAGDAAVWRAFARRYDSEYMRYHSFKHCFLYIMWSALLSRPAAPPPAAEPPRQGSVPRAPGAPPLAPGLIDPGGERQGSFLFDGLRGAEAHFAGTGGQRSYPVSHVGTMFNVVLGREVPITTTPRNLNFAGGAVSFEYPVPRLWGAELYVDVAGWSVWGHNDATVRIGEANVAFTYLFPNPATGTTGVLAGASGQQVSVRTNGEAIDFRIGFEWSQRWPEINPIAAVFGVGAMYQYSDTGHHVTQQSLFFPDVWSRTHLSVDDHFVAPLFRLGAKADDGVFYGSLVGFAAPGAVITDATARQHNRCGPCGNPGDRDVMLSRSFSQTRFAVKAGVDFAFGMRVMPGIALEAGFNYTHTSHLGFLRPPFTPTEQPVRLDHDSGNRFGGRFGIKITF